MLYCALTTRRSEKIEVAAAAASTLAVQVSVTPVHARDEIEGVIVAQAGNPGGGLIVMPDAFNATNHGLIIALADRYSVPAIYGYNFAESGGLIFYGADFAESFRLGAGYVSIFAQTRRRRVPLQNTDQISGRWP